MNSELNMQDIIHLLIANNDITIEDAEWFVKEFFSLIERGLSTDELVEVKDFGAFMLTQVEEHKNIVVNTQEKIVIPSHRDISFAPAQILKDLVNKPFALFETILLNEGVFIDDIKHDSINDDCEEENTIEEYELTKKNDINKTNLMAKKNDKKGSKERVSEEVPTPSSETPVVEATSPKSEKSSKKNQPTVVSSKGQKSKGKTKSNTLGWSIAIALIIILAIGFAYNYYFVQNNLANHEVQESEIPRPIKEVAPAIEVTPTNELAETEEAKNIENLENTVEAGSIVKMPADKTLRLIALDKYGNKEFWVYIYMKNKAKIKNPNVVTVGLELVLPRKNEFEMDANNPSHVTKAKKMGEEMLEKFK